MAKILIVDDDPDFVSIVRSILQSEGYGISVASNGDQALKVMKKEKPDLVLLDIMMSYVLDGVDVSHKIAEDPELQGTPVLLVTSLTVTPEAGLFPTNEAVPVDGWITKPVNPAALKERVAALLARG